MGDWDGSWEGATSIDGLGWYAVFRIPSPRCVVFNEVQRTASPMGPENRALIVKFTRQLDLVR